MSPATHAWLIDLLDTAGADYRTIDHRPEGRTEVVSAYRAHPLAQAAKCVVARVRVGRRDRRYLLAVVSGDRRVDLERLRALCDGTAAALAPRDVAERLTRCVSGSIIPFTADPELALVVDPELLEHDELYFNAARLDRSIALRTTDYLALARPRVERIAA
jgi:Ala-tRNA(Pro) deacylase